MTAHTELPRKKPPLQLTGTSFHRRTKIRFIKRALQPLLKPLIELREEETKILFTDKELRPLEKQLTEPRL